MRTDQELLEELVRDGTPAEKAFDELWVRYSGTVFPIHKVDHEHQEAIEEAFMIMVVKVQESGRLQTSDGRPVENLPAWIRRTAQGKLNDLWKREARARKPAQELKAEVEAVATVRGKLKPKEKEASPIPDVNREKDAIATREALGIIRMDLHACIKNLSEQLQHTLQLWHRDDLSGEEITRKLGLGGKSTVTERLKSARRQLSECLKGKGWKVEPEGVKPLLDDQGAEL